MSETKEAVLSSPATRLEDALARLARARGKKLIGVDGLNIASTLSNLLGGITVDSEPVTTHRPIPEGAKVECEGLENVLKQLDILIANLENIAAYGVFLQLIEKNLEPLSPDEITAKNDRFFKLLKSKEVGFNNNADDYDVPKNRKNWLRRSIASFDYTLNNNPFKAMRVDWNAIKKAFLDDDFFGARAQAAQVIAV